MQSLEKKDAYGPLIHIEQRSMAGTRYGMGRRTVHKTEQDTSRRTYVKDHATLPQRESHPKVNVCAEQPRS
jgi:hypothetical protein